MPGALKETFQMFAIREKGKNVFMLNTLSFFEEGIDRMTEKIGILYEKVIVKIMPGEVLTAYENPTKSKEIS